MESSKAGCSDSVRSFLDSIPSTRNTVFILCLYILSMALVLVMDTSVCQFLVYLHAFCKFLAQTNLDVTLLVYFLFSLQMFGATDDQEAVPQIQTE